MVQEIVSETVVYFYKLLLFIVLFKVPLGSPVLEEGVMLGVVS